MDAPLFTNSVSVGEVTPARSPSGVRASPSRGSCSCAHLPTYLYYPWFCFWVAMKVSDFFAASQPLDALRLRSNASNASIAPRPRGPLGVWALAGLGDGAMWRVVVVGFSTLGDWGIGGLGDWAIGQLGACSNTQMTLTTKSVVDNEAIGE